MSDLLDWRDLLFSDQRRAQERADEMSVSDEVLKAVRQAPRGALRGSPAELVEDIVRELAQLVADLRNQGYRITYPELVLRLEVRVEDKASAIDVRSAMHKSPHLGSTSLIEAGDGQCTVSAWAGRRAL